MTTNETENLIKDLNFAMEEKAKAQDLNTQAYKEACFKILLATLVQDDSTGTAKETIQRWINRFNKR